MPGLSVRFGFATLWLLGAVFVVVTSELESFRTAALARLSVHDTYYVVAHSHYVLSLAAGLAAIAAVYWVAERAARLPLRRWLAWAHFAVTLLGVLLISAPRVVLLSFGMPERGVDLVKTFTLLNGFSSAGYFLVIAGLALFIVLLIDAGRRQIGPSHPASLAP
jgi:cytochrome c oxidase subunit I